jgi:hypothetical protein
VTIDVLAALAETARLYTRDEVLARPSPVPSGPGIYAWFFDEIPDTRIKAGACFWREGWTLLYIGIAPKPPPRNGASASRQGFVREAGSTTL